MNIIESTVSYNGEFDNMEIWDELSKIPIKDIEMIYLHNYSGYSFSEIAYKMNIPIAATYKLYERAVKKVAKHFEITPPPPSIIIPEKKEKINKYCRKLTFHDVL